MRKPLSLKGFPNQSKRSPGTMDKQRIEKIVKAKTEIVYETSKK